MSIGILKDTLSGLNKQNILHHTKIKSFKK